MTEKNLILSKSSEKIIPKVVKIAIKDDTNNKPFKIISTSSLALLLFFIFERYLVGGLTAGSVKG